MVFRHDEQRVVPEASVTAGHRGNAPVTAALGASDDGAARIGQCRMAGVVGSASAGRQCFEALEEQAVVGVVTASGEAGGVDSRRTAKGVDAQAAVLGEHPTGEGGRLLAGLEVSVCREGRPGLLNRHRSLAFPQGDDPDAVGLEECREFPHFSSIGRPENEFLVHRVVPG